MAPDEVVRALRELRYRDVVGVAEDQHVEFKEGWYRLEDPQQKWELAKDVGAMANAGGGIIVRGVATASLAATAVDVAIEVKPIPTTAVDLSQHRSVVKDHLYPKVSGVSFELLEAPAASDRGERCILVIRVPAQPSDPQPFIVSYAFTSEGRRVEAVNIPVRDGAHTDWLPPGVIHRDLADGRRSRLAVDAHRSEAHLPTDSADTASVADLAVQVSESIEQFMGWADGTTYALVATPVQAPASVPDDFYRLDGLAGALAHPPQQHHAGFNLSFEEAPERVGPDLVVSSGRARCLWLRPSGTFVAAINAIGDLLSWPSDRNPEHPSPLRLNHLVLTEYTYLFARMVNEQLALIYGDYRFAVVMRGARGRTWTFTLPPGYPPQVLVGDGHGPTGPEMVVAVEGTRDSGDDTYRMVAAVFDFFGMPRARMSFTSSDSRIDPDLFR